MPVRPALVNFLCMARLYLLLLNGTTGANIVCLLLLFDRKSLHYHSRRSDFVQGDLPLSMCRAVFFGELEADGSFCDA